MNRSGSLSSLLLRNSILNLLTQGGLMVLAVATIPVLNRGLSEESFGLLTLLWAFVGYFTLLDFGISRSVTKFVAELMSERGEAEIRTITWISLVLTAMLGAASCVVLFLTTPWLVNDVFTVAPARVPEAIQAFELAAVGIPFMLLFGTIRGVFMAYQRFGLVNLFQGVMGCFQWAGSAALVLLGFGLREIMLLTVVVRFVAAAAALACLPRILPGFFGSMRLWDRGVARKLFVFGGWVSVSQAVSPLFLYLDRVLIGTLLSVSAVAYYAVPQEALTRLLIIPMSLTTTLFPAMSQLTVDDSGKADILYSRSVKYLILAFLPLSILLVGFAPDILTAWMGSVFASQSTEVFQILSVGLFFNMLAQVPATSLLALGRPQLSAIFQVAELPLVLVLNLILIPHVGVVGAALAWSVRVVIDAVLLFGAVYLLGRRRHSEAGSGSRLVAMSLQPALMCVAIASVCFIENIFVRISATAVFLTLYALSVWRFDLDEVDKRLFGQLRHVFARQG